MSWLAGRDQLPYCYLTTTGRISGRPHRIEIWFATDGERVYLLSGGGDRSDWVRNLLADPRITISVGDVERPGTARIVTDDEEERLARRLLAAKYQRWEEGQPLSDWARSALPVAVDVHVARDGGSAHAPR